MISGKLPNDTVWWLSTDSKKIWIESENLELEKFKNKKYSIKHERIYFAGKGIGELATSRLDSRRRKDAWVIKLEAMIDVYPGLLEEINRKEIEEKKKKKTRTQGKRSRKIEPKKEIIKDEPKNEIIGEPERETIEWPPKKEPIEEDKKEIIEIKNNIKLSDNNVETKKEIQSERSYFDMDWPYVTWIKGEVDKNENNKLVIPIKSLKEKMGEEYVKMPDMRIYFGLNKILPNIGITVELRSVKRDNKIESMAIIKKMQEPK